MKKIIKSISPYCLTGKFSKFLLFIWNVNLTIGLEPRFGLGLLPSDFVSDRVVPRGSIHHLPTGYRRGWALAREAAKELNKDQKNLHFGKDGFQACVDVHHFQPSEITVKTLDNTVIIEGKHEVC